MKAKIFITALLRKLGWMKGMDRLYFLFLYIRTYKERKTFRRDHPDFILPPAYFMYETFGLNCMQYYRSSEAAAWLLSHFGKYKEMEGLRILDWGCGPGRIIRHLPSLVGKSCRCYGTDYNAKYVQWCAANIPEVTFRLNGLEPPLPFDGGMFDVICGISIFTHLSEKMHYAWFEELMRVLKPGGILFLTLHGKAFDVKLPAKHLRPFSEGKLIVLSDTSEGHRTFTAFHPESFVRRLAGAHEVLEFEPGTVINGKPQQDVWIFRRIP
jgi:SAM-dependent methyltransferase